MASEAGEIAQEEDGDEDSLNSERKGRPEQESDSKDDDYDDEEEEEEPRLEYTSLTKKLTSVYRNGDATSAFIVAGDKMVSCCWDPSALQRPKCAPGSPLKVL